MIKAHLRKWRAAMDCAIPYNIVRFGCSDKFIVIKVKKTDCRDMRIMELARLLHYIECI
jgi:hypothetical protein